MNKFNLWSPCGFDSRNGPVFIGNFYKKTNTAEYFLHHGGSPSFNYCVHMKQTIKMTDINKYSYERGNGEKGNGLRLRKKC